MSDWGELWCVYRYHAKCVQVNVSRRVVGRKTRCDTTNTRHDGEAKFMTMIQRKCSKFKIK